METKECAKCKAVKPLTEFFHRKRNKNGFHAWCKFCATETHKRKYATDADYRKKRIQNTLDSRRKSELGVDRDQFKTILFNQNNRCAICSIELDNSRRGLVGRLDHCHTTKKVRGILCKDCNTGLGLFRDNTEFLFSAITYLKANR